MNDEVKVVKPRVRRLSISQMNKFVRSKGKEIRENQIKLTEPLFVYKRINSKVNGVVKRFVASLVIPKGAIVNLTHESYSSEGKMRASMAFCYSIVGVRGNKDGDRLVVDSGFSLWDYSFKYYSGSSLGLTLEDFMNLSVDDPVSGSWDKKKRAALNKCKAVPMNAPFAKQSGICAAGIHFFVEQHKAANY
jgi:hypothetical protein